MTRTCFRVTAAGSETVNAPRTFCRRWRGVRPAWLSVARSRISVLDASVSRHSGCVLPSDSSAAIGQRASLVETALGKFCPVQRHRNHQHLLRRLGCQLGNCLSQHPAQPTGRRVQPVVLERVNGRLHPVPVRPVGHRPHKRRRRQPAGPAQSAARRTGQHRRVQRVAAASTQFSAPGGKLRPANITDGHRGEMRQRGAAESTRGRGGARNPMNPWDFAAHEPPRANGKSPRLEDRSLVNRSHCGRHTSLGVGQAQLRRLADSIPGPGLRFHVFSRKTQTGF